MLTLLRAAPRSGLDPTPDEARSELRRELLDPRYHDQNLLQQALDWIKRSLGNGLEAARGAPSLSTVVAMVLFLLLVVALGWLLSRARRTARASRGRGEVLTHDDVSADELAARARRARDEGRLEDALVEGFRALARRQVERGTLPDDPGATAREVAAALATNHPAAESRVLGAASLFEEVRYGARPVTRAQVDDVLALDDTLVGRR